VDQKNCCPEPDSTAKEGVDVLKMIWRAATDDIHDAVGSVQVTLPAALSLSGIREVIKLWILLVRRWALFFNFPVQILPGNHESG
jgi:hypothetical protein